MVDVLSRLASALAGRYTLERELGRGGMATVWLAQDLKHDRPVALKVLRPEIAGALGPERFLREIKVTARLAHPHILPLLDSGEAEGLIYYVMPFVAGESLRDRLDREKQLPLEEALQVAREVADALGYAHAQDVLHRDVKPENILLQAGHAMVADFGIARAITAAGGTKLTETGIAVGTPAYMSPEQCAGRGELDGRSDLYALGCVLYEMLSGRPPFVGPTVESVVRQHLAADVPPITSIRPAVPGVVAAALAGALAKAPADRFSTVGQFGEALRLPTTGATAAMPATRPRHTWRWVTGATVLGALALGVWRAQRPPPIAPDGNLIAVLPFRTIGVDSIYGEGMVDLLARNLDGAGNLRTKAPSTYLKGWVGRADRGSAEALSRATGVGLVVFGDVVAEGADSVQLRAALLDATGDDPPLEVAVHGPLTRLGGLTDSLSVGLLRALGQRRPVAAVRQGSLSARPLPALKEYLQGEQAYRRLEYDSALVHYARAIAEDSAFALAYRRMALTLSFDPPTSVTFSSWETYASKAAALNRDLPPRDSLLILGDSLAVAFFASRDPSQWTFVLNVRQETTRRFPGDPEAWLALGELLQHTEGPASLPSAVLAAFERAIALDSSFAPAYEHVFQDAVQAGRPGHAVELLRAFIRHVPQAARGGSVGPLRLVDGLLDAKGHPAPGALGAADRATATAVFRAAFEFFGDWPDAEETAVRLSRRLLEGGLDFRGAPPWVTDSLGRLNLLSSALTSRGHLADGYAAFPRFTSLPFSRYAEIAWLGGVPVDSASAAFDRALAAKPITPALPLGRALPFWLERRDTVSLARYAKRSDSEAMAAGGTDRRLLLRHAGEARAYLALASGDSTAALRRLESLDDSVCVLDDCRRSVLVEARLLAARDQPREAAALLDRYFYYSTTPVAVLAMLERARLAEALGERTRAVQAYQFVLDTWRSADPVLQRYVGEAREALARLGVSLPR